MTLIASNTQLLYNFCIDIFWQLLKLNLKVIFFLDNELGNLSIIYMQELTREINSFLPCGNL